MPEPDETEGSSPLIDTSTYEKVIDRIPSPTLHRA